MGRRGAALREHILHTAKDVFLEEGYEHVSMDEIALRSETTKRSLYAHFENKEALFLAVLDLVRALHLARVRTPADYAQAAITQYCGKFMETVLSERPVQMCRLAITEAGRFPEAAASLHAAMFGTAEAHIARHLITHYGLKPARARKAAQQLVGRLLYPHWLRAMMGVSAPLSSWTREPKVSRDVDMKAVREAVGEMMEEIKPMKQ
jgi:AcrR family transcriptional regulator